MVLNLKNEIAHLEQWSGLQPSGRVTEIVGLLIESAGPCVHLGELCYVYNRKGDPIPCEVVGFKQGKVLLMCLGSLSQIAPGAEVCPSGEVPVAAVSMGLCGRVVDALGRPLDGKGPIPVSHYYPLEAPPPKALQRRRIDQQFYTGIKAIDATCSAAYGQRFGIFSGAGVGKSSLLSMIAKMSQAEINVIALIGERGREVREFIERDLGPEGLARSVVVVVTSDEPALLRAKGAATATAFAEYFRDSGKDVLLMMDSVTRYAMALREIGLAVGEPPTTKGYTPSVFAALPRLLERAGNSDKGSMTGIYTILVEGDDLNDPIADTVRSILDGHIVLSRRLASANHYPAIDVLASLSRVMKEVVNEEQIGKAGRLRDLLQTYTEAEDLISIGAYTSGSNANIDAAIAKIDPIRGFLRQKSDEKIAPQELWEMLSRVL